MKKIKLRKLLAVTLTGIMLLSLAACGSKKTGGNSSNEENGKAIAEEVTGPITIEFWHTRGSGANGSHMEKVIERFNDENEYGITVVGTYMGDYGNTASKAYTALAAGNNPTMIITNADSITQLANSGVLADMAPYIERDGFDLDNIPESLRSYMDWDGKILSFPYTASTPVFYYNKALWTEEVPTSIEDLATKGAAIKAKNPDLKVFALGIDVTFNQRPILQSMGSNGLMNETGDGAGCLDDGNLETFLTDWSSWIDEGWCETPSVTSGGTKMMQNLLTGKLASMVYSTGSMGNILQTAEEYGLDIGVSSMVGYGGYAASVGGGHLLVLDKNHSGQEIAAAWEFIKFLLDDQQVAENAADTGYLPITKSSIETDIIKNLWATHPGYEVAYKQIEIASYNTRSEYSAEWTNQVHSAISYVIQDKSMKPKDAVDYLKTQEMIIFGN